MQRSGGAINVNVHFHILFIDGVYLEKDGVQFREVEISHTDVEATVRRIQDRVVRLLQKRGLLSDSYDQTEIIDETQCELAILDQCQGASVQNRIALGVRAGKRVRRVGSFGFKGEDPFSESTRCVGIGGFSLHANVSVTARARGKLEKLCRYLARPPVAEGRLARRQDGEILYHLKAAWSDGTNAILFSPMEFIEKLVAIIPQPRIHLARFHGVLAPNAKWRKAVVPAPAANQPEPSKLKSSEESMVAHKQRLTWAKLLKRTFGLGLDLEVCPDCGGKVRLIAVIENHAVARKILDHLGLSSHAQHFRSPRWPPPE